MPDPIPKHLTDRNDWTVEQTIEYARTGELPVNPEWTSRRNEALTDAGLEVDDDTPTPIEEMSVSEHAQRIAANRHP